MWLLLRNCIFLLFALVSSEVITLIKDDDITCVVTEASVNSGLYLYRQGYNEFGKVNLTRIDKIHVQLDANTWNTSDMPANFDMVTDERWTDFLNQKRLRLNNIITFSLCINKTSNATLNIYSESLNESFIISLESIHNFVDDFFCQWNHYVLKKNNKAVSFEGNETYLNFQPVWVTFPNKNYKLHKYEFFYADTVSLKKSYINVNTSEYKEKVPECLSVYVSVDEGCFLNITLESLEADHKILKEQHVKGFNKKNSLKIWEKYELRGKSHGKMRLGFIRGRYDKETQGYWAVNDIQICGQEKIVYKSKLNDTSISTSYICKVLNSTKGANFTDCTPPMIGKNCNMTCRSILGPDYPNCEEHKICLGDQCRCAWGYRGTNCNEKCRDKAWGMNCENECNPGCIQCDPKKGCKKCSEKTFGKDCSRELPVVRYPPELRDVSDNSITILVNLEFGENEKTPEKYAIQFQNRNDGETFKNYSTHKYVYMKETINMNLTRENSYKIRVLLIFDGKSFKDNIPELVVFKKSLLVNSKDKSKLEVSWDKLEKKEDDTYLLKYTCFYMCLNDTLERNNETNENAINIEVTRPFVNCIIKLFTRTNRTEKLIDKVVFETSTAKIKEEELPKNVIFSEEGLEIELNECGNFNGPLNYSVEYKCNSDWCRNKSTRHAEYVLRTYQKIIKVQLEDLPPFTSYNVSIVAKRLNQNDLSHTYPDRVTPPKEPHQLINLSVYSTENDILSIKWQHPYPPTGRVELYKINLPNGENLVGLSNITQKCDLWDNFVCAKISGIPNLNSYNISISAKNYGVEQWSAPIILNWAIQNVTTKPENLHLQPSSESPDEVILNWEHPLFTYGKLDKFCVGIDESRCIPKNVSTYSKNYNQTIKVEFGEDYNISIWGSNEFDGEKVYVFLVVSQPIEEFSPNPFLKWCLDSCYITPPPHNDTNFTIDLKDGHNEEEKISCNKSQCKINENIDEARNKINLLVLVYKDKSVDIEFSTKNQNLFKVEITNVTLLCCLLILIIVLLGFLFYSYKRKKFLCKKNKRMTKGASELLIKCKQEEYPLVGTNYAKDLKEFKHKQTVKIKNFEKYFLSAIKKDPHNNNITEQFQMLSETRTFKNTHYALEAQNLGKNRYKNFLPYDETRVILTNNKGGDYINASYIDNHQNTFIATQAPLPYTLNDFWAMIFQENVTTIVMLIEQYENGKLICEQYWPNEQLKLVRFGKYLVQLLSTKKSPDYIKREFKVIADNQIQIVQHFQYISWPSHGTPDNIQNFTYLIREVMELPHNSPILVHCSAGCGRTGTFLLCYIAIQMGIEKKQVNFFEILNQLRKQRPGLVSNVDQYIFAHWVIWEYFFGKDFSIDVTDDFELKIEEASSDVSLNILISHLEKAQFVKRQKTKCFLTEEDKLKNRFPNILPGDSQIFLPISVFDPSNYINAITVDCYYEPQKFIVTQQPLPNTIPDFWTLIKDYRIGTIISLNKIIDNEMECPKFWPNGDEEWTFDDINTIKFCGEINNNNVYNEIEIKIVSKNREVKIVNIIDVKSWNREAFQPTDVKDLISIWKKISTLSGQIVVACYDGATASGLFVALAFLLKRIKVDQKCDVFSAVKSVRQSRPQFFENPEQLKILYKAALAFVLE